MLFIKIKLLNDWRVDELLAQIKNKRNKIQTDMNYKPETINPKLETRNPKPETVEKP